MTQVSAITIPLRKDQGGTRDKYQVVQSEGPEWTLEELQKNVGGEKGKVLIETVPLGEGKGDNFLGQLILEEFAKTPGAPPLPPQFSPEAVAPVIGLYAQKLIREVLISAGSAVTNNWGKEDHPEDLTEWALKNLLLIVDEEALLKDNPQINLIASLLTGLPIHNHAVLIRSGDFT